MRYVFQAIGLALAILIAYHGFGDLHHMVKLETLKAIEKGLPELEEMSQGLTGDEPGY